MMIRVPERMPAPPNPQILLPTIKTIDVGATPEIRNPITKTNSPARKFDFAE
jgi:hypothetical protein